MDQVPWTDNRSPCLIFVLRYDLRERSGTVFYRMTMKITSYLLLLGAFLSASLLPAQNAQPNCKNSAYILEQVKKGYDAKDHWSKVDLKVHLQEPRVGNPQRHTQLTLNRSDGYFEMSRPREGGTVKRVITSKGEEMSFLNGESEISEELRIKYRLNSETHAAMKRFYDIMYGLPMSVEEGFWEQIEPAEKSVFEGRDAYRINMVLNEELISKYWTLIIGVDDYQLLALEFTHPEEPDNEGELIKFEGEYEVDGVIFPRVRHWYLLGSNEYLGTDIIVEEL